MIFLGIPSARDWKPLSVSSLLAAVMHTTAKTKNKIIYENRMQCSNLPVGREKIVEAALESGAEYLIMMDDDMAFPADAIIKLIEHDVDCVGIDYRKKSPHEYETTAVYMDGTKLTQESDKKGLVPVLCMGLGLVCVKTDALRKTQAPRFQMLWDANKGKYVGEDTDFFRCLYDAGVKSYCDLDLSRQCAHVGDMPYGLV